MMGVETMTDLPQLVPSEVCLRCDVCCRFPETDSPMRPFFTAQEIREAVAAGIPEDRFPHPDGGRIALVSHPRGKGYVCPAFDVATQECRIYDARPLDCRLYPFVVSRHQRRRVLAVDHLCPFVQKVGEAAAVRFGSDFASAIVDRLSVGLEIPTPETYGVVALLPDSPSPEGFRPVAAGEAGAKEWMELRRLLAARRPWLSIWSAEALSVWESTTRFHETERGGFRVVLAESDGLFYAPIPPLRADEESVGLSDVGDPEEFVRTVGHVLSVLEGINRSPAASRIEGVTEEMADLLQRHGFSVAEKEFEYLYQRSAIAGMVGGAYRGPRAAYNQFERLSPDASFETIEPDDVDECLVLFDRWASGKATKRSQSAETILADPAGLVNVDVPVPDDLAAIRPIHQRALSDAARRHLGWRGWLVREGGRVRGYTLGFPLSPQVFCDWAEVAEPGFPGLSAFLFREICQEIDSFELVNAMSDQDLPGLRKAKESYRPWKLVKEFVATARRPS